MVGIPRSRGCRTCVQRRVRCDLHKPTCDNCRKGNRDCNYAEDFKFQDEGAKLRRRFAGRESVKEVLEKSSLSSSPDTPSLSTSSSDTGQIDGALISNRGLPDFNNNLALGVKGPNYNAFFALMENRQLTLDEGELAFEDDGDQKQDESERHIKNGLEVISPPPFLSAPGLAQDQMFTLFRSATQPPNQLASIPKPFRIYEGWLSRLPNLTGKNRLLDNAVRALSLAHVGNIQGNRALLNQSRPYYGRAIRLLSVALSDLTTGMASETLSATMLLSFYEMFVSESNDSWIKHAGGVSALMKLREPSRYRYGIDREIFLAYRHAIVIECIYKEVPCFLAQPAWAQVARDIFNDTTDKITDDDLLELYTLFEEFNQQIVLIPGYLSDLKNFATAYRREKFNYSSSKDFMIELMRRVVTSRAGLKAYFANFEGCLIKLGYKWTSYETSDPLISKNYTFVNVFVALSCTGFWNILIILNLMILDIQRKTGQEQQSFLQAENRECALDICRSTKYLLRSTFLGPLFCIFGLRTNILCLQNPKEKEWCIAKLFEIGQTHMAMARHIPGFDSGASISTVKAAITDRGKVEEVDQAGETTSNDQTSNATS